MVDKVNLNKYAHAVLNVDVAHHFDFAKDQAVISMPRISKNLYELRKYILKKLNEKYTDISHRVLKKIDENTYIAHCPKRVDTTVHPYVECEECEGGFEFVSIVTIPYFALVAMESGIFDGDAWGNCRDLGFLIGVPEGL